MADLEGEWYVDGDGNVLPVDKGETVYCMTAAGDGVIGGLMNVRGEVVMEDPLGEPDAPWLWVEHMKQGVVIHVEGEHGSQMG